MMEKKEKKKGNTKDVSTRTNLLEEESAILELGQTEKEKKYKRLLPKIPV